MKVILGVDIGGSTTKIVGFNGDIEIGNLKVRADEQLTSIYGALGRFLDMYNIPIKNLESIVLTGVGSSFIKDNIFGIPTYKVDEFKAIGYGGMHVSDKSSALVVSMGTGTAYVKANESDIQHIGGSGVGGGTLIGLSSLLLGTTDFDLIEEYSKSGCLSNVDLRIDDICKELIPFLPPDTTASNFGNISTTVSKSDLSLGILNMIYQTIGLLAIFYTKNDDIENIVLTGSLTRFSVMRQIFKRLEILHNVEFIIPNNAVFSTALGAIIYYNKFLR